MRLGQRRTPCSRNACCDDFNHFRINLTHNIFNRPSFIKVLWFDKLCERLQENREKKMVHFALFAKPYIKLYSTSIFEIFNRPRPDCPKHRSKFECPQSHIVTKMNDFDFLLYKTRSDLYTVYTYIQIKTK